MKNSYNWFTIRLLCTLACLALFGTGMVAPVLATNYQNIISDYKLLESPTKKPFKGASNELPPVTKYPAVQTWYFRSLIGFNLPKTKELGESSIINDYLQKNYNRQNSSLNNLQYQATNPIMQIIVEKNITSQIILGLNFGYSSGRVRFQTNDAVVSNISLSHSELILSPELSYYINPTTHQQPDFGRVYVGLGYGRIFSNKQVKDGNIDKIIYQRTNQDDALKAILGWNYDFEKLHIGTRYEFWYKVHDSPDQILSLDARWGF